MVEFDGSEVDKNLSELINSALPNAITKAITKACLVVESDAKQNAPVGDGQLRQSITHQVKDNEGVVGTNVEYAPYVEIGTGIYSTQGTGRQTAWSYQDVKGNWHKTKGMEAQPFLKPAVDKNVNKIVDTIANTIKNDL